MLVPLGILAGGQISFFVEWEQRQQGGHCGAWSSRCIATSSMQLTKHPKIQIIHVSCDIHQSRSIIYHLHGLLPKALLESLRLQTGGALQAVTGAGVFSWVLAAETS